MTITRLNEKIDRLEKNIEILKKELARIQIAIWGNCLCEINESSNIGTGISDIRQRNRISPETPFLLTDLFAQRTHEYAAILNSKQYDDKNMANIVQGNDKVLVLGMGGGEVKQIPSNPAPVPKKQLQPVHQPSKPLLSVPSKPAVIDPDPSENGSTYQDPDTVRIYIEQTIEERRKIMAEQRKERELKQKMRLAEIRAEQEQRKKELEDKQRIKEAQIEEMKKKNEEDALKRAQARAAEHSKNADKNEMQRDSYELYDREQEDLDEGSDEDPESDKMKAIPLWAKGVQLKELLCRQFTELIDPDSIFNEVSICDLAEIFNEANPKRKVKYKDRNSSGNWKHDTLTFVEKMGYRRDMGFKITS